MERVHRIVCSKCKSALTSKAGVPVGQEIACPKCKAKFKVAAPEEEVIEDFDVVDDDGVDDEKPAPAKKAPAPAAKQTPKPKSKPAIEVEEDDEEEPKPRPKKKLVEVEEDDEEEEPKPKPKKKPVPVDEEDDEEPTPKKKKARGDDEDEDEDEEDRPRSKSRGKDENRPRRKKDDEEEEEKELSSFGRLKKNIWVRLSLLAVLLATAGILGYKLYLKRNPGPDEDDKLAQKLEEDRKAMMARNQNNPNFNQPIFNQPKGNPFPKKEPKGNKDENYRKLIVGKWKLVRGTPDFVGSDVTEFTADGKIISHPAMNAEPTETGTYRIENEMLHITSYSLDKGGQKREKRSQDPISKMTDSELVTGPFTFNREK